MSYFSVNNKTNKNQKYHNALLIIYLRYLFTFYVSNITTLYKLGKFIRRFSIIKIESVARITFCFNFLSRVSYTFKRTPTNGSNKKY